MENYLGKIRTEEDEDIRLVTSKEVTHKIRIKIIRKS